MRQKQALTIMMSGANVFLTGAPGAGKTYVLNQFIRHARDAGKRVAVTASTGIATSHLGGTTIHSWSGLGILDELTAEDAARLGASDRLLKRYNGTDILVIDEVSMLHGQRLDMINRLAKATRASEKPFGGLQVILVGDLFQLPPVTRSSNYLDFAHLSAAWQELDLKICYITEQHRQQQHDGLLELLEAMRAGEIAEHHGELLQARVGRQPGEDQVVTRLFAHNIDVEAINQRHLAALPASSRRFAMNSRGSKSKLEQLAKGLLVPETLELKEGAEVMFVANNFGEGYVNGSLGRVMGFENGLPVVQLVSGRTIIVTPFSWNLTEDGQVRAEVSQLPLRLAWAITIHKSQGMSLDAALIDLGKAFTSGMGYVALSRVRSLAGLYLHGLNAMALHMHDGMAVFDTALRHMSASLAAATPDFVPPDRAAIEAVLAQKGDPELFERLKQWRLTRARTEGVAPFTIAHNTTLNALTVHLPQTPQQLLAVPGFGPRKIENYGDAILGVIRDYQSKSASES